MRRCLFLVSVSAMVFVGSAPTQLCGQGLVVRHGTPISAEVRSIYDRGLRYLVDGQESDGSWNSSYGNGPGIAGICCLALLSSGEDPNYGAYAATVQRTLRYVVRSVDPSTGFTKQGRGGRSTMYEHGFATLALAEAYGAVDEELLWAGQVDTKPLGLGKALELAVRASLGSQDNNPLHAWRYGPDASDADTSVSGAILVSLLAARNAGIEIPDGNMEKALKYYETCTFADGTVAYSGGGGGHSLALSAISCLVFAIARKRDSEPHQSTLKQLVERVDEDAMSHPYYTRYYVAQALFQGDFDAWTRWNERTTETIRDEQQENGSIGQDAYSTSMSLLALALNFRCLPIYER